MITKLWDLVNYTLEPLNIDLIWGYQNAARVKKPYCMVNYNSIRLPDHEFYGLINENGIRMISSWRRATADLQFFCGEFNSYNFASKAASLLAGERSLDKAYQLDVAIGHRLMLQHAPVLLNQSQYEDRSIYQFEFYYTENIEDDAGRIETVIIDGNYENGAAGGAGGNITPLNCHHVVSTQDVYVDEHGKG